jgi:hypothetical protein
MQQKKSCRIRIVINQAASPSFNIRVPINNNFVNIKLIARNHDDILELIEEAKKEFKKFDWSLDSKTWNWKNVPSDIKEDEYIRSELTTLLTGEDGEEKVIYRVDAGRRPFPPPPNNLRGGELNGLISPPMTGYTVLKTGSSLLPRNSVQRLGSFEPQSVEVMANQIAQHVREYGSNPDLGCHTRKSANSSINYIKSILGYPSMEDQTALEIAKLAHKLLQG